LTEEQKNELWKAILKQAKSQRNTRAILR